VHGSAVRGGFVAGRSDVDLLLVLHDDARAVLEAIGPTLQLARASLRIECVVLRADELQASADVFPLLYDDVRAWHVVLAGADLFKDLVITDAHRRLRIEQELRDARMRLRRMLIDEVGDEDALAMPLARKQKQLRSPLHALLRLRGNAHAPDDLQAVLTASAALFDVDTAALTGIDRAPLAAADALAKLLDRAIATVDGHAS
jgi:hypothetical protein